MESKPLVTFVILNWNQPELTADCLDSLRQQDYPEYHVLLVDNGSRDNSVEFFQDRYLWVELLPLKDNIGYGLGNNAGIERALSTPTDYIFLLNNDTKVAPDMLSILIEAAEANPRAGIIGPTMYYFDPPDIIWSGENYVNWRLGEVTRKLMGQSVHQDVLRQASDCKVDHIDTCAALIRREVFESIGLLDPRYFINFDDLDFDLRARRAGFDVVYVPSAFMWHKVSLAMGQASPATTYYMTRNALLLFWAYAPLQWKPIAVAAIIFRTLRTILAWSIKPVYRNKQYRRKLKANIFALRDFFSGRFGRMGEDVTEACYGE